MEPASKFVSNFSYQVQTYFGEYTGQVVGDKPHGYGIWSDGIRKYRGEWSDGLYHGDGALITPNCRYVGQWQAGKYHGVGKLSYDSGTIYHGTFVNGLKHGLFVAHISSGEIAAHTFVNDKINGPSIRCDKENKTTLFRQHENETVTNAVFVGDVAISHWSSENNAADYRITVVSDVPFRSGVDASIQKWDVISDKPIGNGDKRIVTHMSSKDIRSEQYSSEQISAPLASQRFDTSKQGKIFATGNKLIITTLLRNININDGVYKSDLNLYPDIDAILLGPKETKVTLLQRYEERESVRKRFSEGEIYVSLLNPKDGRRAVSLLTAKPVLPLSKANRVLLMKLNSNGTILDKEAIELDTWADWQGNNFIVQAPNAVEQSVTNIFSVMRQGESNAKNETVVMNKRKFDDLLSIMLDDKTATKKTK